MPKFSFPNKDKKENKDSSIGKFRRFRKKFKNLSRFFSILFAYIILTGVVAVMLLARITGDGNLRIVEKTISTAVSPVQNAFNSFVLVISDHLKKIKLRGNIEEEYNKLLLENEKLVYEAMLANELQIQLTQYNSLFDEITLNESMNPISCRVIGRDTGNYFSVFTINKGTSSGIKDFMAVTVNGALIGYTYNVSANKSDVRTIIDSAASIAALIQTSRDQGTIRGTLGIDGKPMCRMYYLPNDHLPRPGDEVVTSGVGMSFPKGIPIGTVRESTRSMEENKQFIVVEPKADFRHVENVIVLRYQPEPIGVTARDGAERLTIYGQVPTAVPIPTIVIGSDSFILHPTYTPLPEGYATTEPITLPSHNPNGTTKDPNSIEYIVPHPTKDLGINITLGPTSTPEPTEPPLEITVEGD